MANDSERIRTDAAAAMLGIKPPAFARLAERRRWIGERDPYDGRWQTFDRATIEQEAKARVARNARVSKHDLAVASKCAATIRAFWAKRGHTVDVEAIGVEIVSDLVNALPVRR